MSILTMVQNIAADAGFQKPSFVVGNNDEIAIQLLAQINRETLRLSNEFFWQKMVQNYQFNFINNQNTYALPSDYNFILPNTIWNHSARQPIVCPLTPEDYMLQTNYLVTSAYYKMIYVYGNLMYVTPLPSNGLIVSLANNPFTTTLNSNVVTVTVPDSSVFTNGEQITILGAVDTHGILAANLNLIATAITIVDATHISFIAGSSATSAGTGGGAAITLNSGDLVIYQYCSNNYFVTAGNTPIPAILSDSDTTRVPEYIVELGVKMRFLVAKGLITPAELESSYEKKDYDFQIKRQMMIDGIGQKTLRMRTGNNAYWLAAYTQDSNWPTM